MRLEAQSLQQIGWIVMTRGKYEAAHMSGPSSSRRRRSSSPSSSARRSQSGALNITPKSRETGDGTELSAQPGAASRPATAGRSRTPSSCRERRAARAATTSATPELQEGLSLARSCRTREHLAGAHVSRPCRASQRGRRRRGQPVVRQALSIANDRDKRVVAECLQGSARRSPCGSTRRPRGSRHEALLEAIGATPSASEVAVTDHFVPNCRSDLGDAKFQEEWAAGYGLQQDDAVALALGAPVALGD